MSETFQQGQLRDVHPARQRSLLLGTDTALLAAHLVLAHSTLLILRHSLGVIAARCFHTLADTSSEVPASLASHT